ncbi:MULTISPECIES: bifunctional 2-polyprenyl-6-hydroxyphenol methylase/3-demethylubiquinol 3-O-methyltransferase UbiG [unclassified Massilia]|uniref:class I SAM-dependent methyltransferase n=1 Tax=unclassified Massilia TaxID=2609279 RepID=UPI000A422CDF|nr:MULTISPECIES: class I SAM-dependent methyltransferase [unclassified Massilia]
MNQTPPNQVSFYRAFEDRYRGARHTIKDRLRAYTPFTAPLLQLGRPAVALDLGCGRGEWLELLGETGFEAKGVDLDEGMLEACRERGLDASHGDALAALRAQPDDSLALVSAFHLVEHLPFNLVQELIAEALRALRPGGLLVMETPNPENLTVGATSFYLDPSHLHPLPPGLLGFAAEHAGFARQRIVRLQEDPHLHADAQVGLITVLEGVSPDYAVVAQKTAAPEALAPLDAAFATPWGITLGQLAQRYEERLAAQHAEIHRILARIELHGSQLAGEQARTDRQLDVLHGQLGDTHRQLGDAYRQLGELHQLMDEVRQHSGRQDERIAHVEAHAAEMSQRVVDLLSSTSWRITEPLRRVMALVYRLRNARREGRLGSAVKWRAKHLVRRTGGAVLRRPAMKRAARVVLRKMPALEARLYALMLNNSEATRVVLEPEPDELSPRAARVYRQLKEEQARMNNADRH